MSKIIKIRKGLEIKLIGKAETIIGENVSVLNASIRPTDFQGLVPKLIKKEGESVKRGDTVLIDKYKTDICFVSPISGTVKQVVRGDKRKLLEVIIEADGEDSSVDFGKEFINETNPEKIKEILLKSGVWPFIKQRPYGVIAGYEDTPRDIFISFFDSSPLAADFDFILNNKAEEINIALEKISLLTEGNVYLNFKSGASIKQAIKHNNKFIYNYFEGPHPAGLPGVQINKLKPINKGEIIWTINASDLPIIGHLLINGDYKPERAIAFAGSEVENPKYYNVFVGADLSALIAIGLKSENVRVVSGSLLTGTNITERPFLGFYDTSVCVVPEGDKYELFGWALPGLNKLSVSPTFLSKLIPGKKFIVDTNFHGGERAYVATGEYEKVCPIDIYPQILIKAIMAEDIDKMEQLGIYEVIEEDLALCEFVCTSKVEVQDILRKGLDLMRKEMA